MGPGWQHDVGQADHRQRGGSGDGQEEPHERVRRPAAEAVRVGAGRHPAPRRLRGRRRRGVGGTVRRAVAPAHGRPTHSSEPSAKLWCFQIGTVAFRVSMRSRQASKASPRCGADDGRDHGGVADLEVARPVHRPDAGDAVARGDLLADPAQRLDGAGVGGVVEGGDRLAVVVVAHHPHEQRDAPALRVPHGREHLVDGQRLVADVAAAPDSSTPLVTSVTRPPSLRRLRRMIAAVPTMATAALAAPSAASLRSSRRAATACEPRIVSRRTPRHVCIVVCRLPPVGAQGPGRYRPGIDHEGEVTGGSRQHANAVEAVGSSHRPRARLSSTRRIPVSRSSSRCVRWPSRPTVTAAPEAVGHDDRRPPSRGRRRGRTARPARRPCTVSSRGASKWRVMTVSTPSADERGGPHHGQPQSRVDIPGDRHELLDVHQVADMPVVRRRPQRRVVLEGHGVVRAGAVDLALVTTTRWRTPAAAAAVMTVWARRRFRSPARPARPSARSCAEVGARRDVCGGVDPRERLHEGGVGRVGAGGTRTPAARTGSVSIATTAPMRASRRRPRSGGPARRQPSQRAQHGLPGRIRGADHCDVDRATPRANAPSGPRGNSLWPPHGCLVQNHPLSPPEEPSCPTSPRPARTARTRRGAGGHPSAAARDRGDAGRPHRRPGIDPEMARMLKGMGIDKVDPAMLQMVMGQVQAMFASHRRRAVQRGARHRHRPQDGLRRRRRRASSRGPVGAGGPGRPGGRALARPGDQPRGPRDHARTRGAGPSGSRRPCRPGAASSSPSPRVSAAPSATPCVPSSSSWAKARCPRGSCPPAWTPRPCSARWSRCWPG